MAKARKQRLSKPRSAPSPGRRRLKVFKTPIGFHDAYVAAPSRKAALAAWGAGTDLFSAGIAEEVRDPDGKAAKAALARPGEVVREGRAGKEAPSLRPAPASGRGRKKPSRAGLDRAEAALAALEERQSAERAELASEEARLAKKRRVLDARHAGEREKAEARRDAAEARYREALADG